MKYRQRVIWKSRSTLFRLQKISPQNKKQLCGEMKASDSLLQMRKSRGDFPDQHLGKAVIRQLKQEGKCGI